MASLFDDDELDFATSGAPEEIEPHTPLQNQKIFGHARVEELLLGDFQRGSLPGGYLFCGKRGIGKASMAYRLAKFLLAQKPAEPCLFGDAPIAPTSLQTSNHSPEVARVLAGGHSGLLVLEPAFDEKKGKYKSEIPVAEMRKIGNFMSMTAGEGSYRIVIVDPVDALNDNAANAMLKWLEEPPERGLFILVCHTAGKILPTIRSRCRTVSFGALNEQEFSSVLNAQNIYVKENELENLQLLSGGAPGIAVEIHEKNGIKFYQEWIDLLINISPAQMEKLQTLCNNWNGKIEFALMTQIITGCLARIIKIAAGEHSNNPQLQALARRQSVDYWLDFWERTNKILNDTPRLYLDSSQVLLEVSLGMAGYKVAF